MKWTVYVTYLRVSAILQLGVHPSIANSDPLQVLSIHRVALNNDLPSGRDIMASYIQYRAITLNNDLTSDRDIMASYRAQ